MRTSITPATTRPSRASRSPVRRFVCCRADGRPRSARDGSSRDISEQPLGAVRRRGSMRAWLALVLVLAGCGTTGRTPAPSDVADDANATWQLTSGRTRAGEIPLIVEASQIGGTAACNSYAARLVDRGGHVAVTDLSMTAAGCEAPILAVETA